MENNKEDKPLAVVETTNVKKTCKCCSRELPVSSFKKSGTGYRKICIECERKSKGISNKFEAFTSRELIEELKSRGYRGTLKYVKVEEIKI